MSFNTEDLIKISVDLINPAVEDRKKYKILKSIYGEHFTIDQLQKSRIGKSVKKCTKMDGKISVVAFKIIQKWETMIEDYCQKNKHKSSKEKLQETPKPIKSEKSERKHDRKSHCPPQDNSAFENLFNNDLHRINRAVKAEKQPKISPKAQKDSHIDDFKSLINDNSMSLKADELTRKRRSDNFDQISSQKRQKEENISFIPQHLPDLPDLDSDEDAETDHRTDLFDAHSPSEPVANKSKEDIDVTSKYSSQRKVWMPKSRQGAIDEADEEPKKIVCIKGVPVSEIAGYNSRQLMEFEDSNRSVMRETSKFWEKLFMKNYKSASRFEDEQWRDAFMRVEAEEEARLRKISDRLNKKTEISKKNESRAQIIDSKFLPKKSVRNFYRA